MGNGAGIAGNPNHDTAPLVMPCNINAADQTLSSDASTASLRDEFIAPITSVIEFDYIPAACFHLDKKVENLVFGPCRETLPVMMQTQSNPDVNSNFFRLFWEIIATKDADNEIVRLFESQTANRMLDKNAILIRIMRFITFGTRAEFVKKCRAVGRRHAAFGVDEQHLRVFAESLLRTIAVTLGSAKLDSNVKHWVDLVIFAIQQMSIGSDSAAHPHPHPHRHAHHHHHHHRHIDHINDSINGSNIGSLPLQQPPPQSSTSALYSSSSSSSARHGHGAINSGDYSGDVDDLDSSSICNSDSVSLYNSTTITEVATDNPSTPIAMPSPRAAYSAVVHAQPIGALQVEALG